MTNAGRASHAGSESPNLDVLRSVAVLLVLGDHLCTFFGVAKSAFFDYEMLGILGVLMFFVHTSLVLMHSLERQESKFGRQHLWSIFMTRRCFRIYPLAIVVVTAVYALKIPNAVIEKGVLYPVQPHAWLLISNLCLLRDLDKIGPIVGTLWSLPFEMQMYLFLPALYVIARKWSLRGLLGLWLASFIVAIVQYKTPALPVLLRYVPCFMPGILAFRLWHETRRSIPFAWFPIMLFGIILAYMAAHRLGHGAVFRGLPICLLLGLALPHFREVANHGLKTVTHLIAKYSYGIYLTHLTCIWLAFIALGHLAASLQWMAFIISVIGMPVLLFHALEAPGIALGSRVAKRLFMPAPVKTAPGPAAVR